MHNLEKNKKRASRENGYSLIVIKTPCKDKSMKNWAHLDRIYYANDRKDAAKIGFDDEFIYEEIDRKIEDRHKPMIALMRDDALGAFRMWEENTEKTEY